MKPIIGITPNVEGLWFNLRQKYTEIILRNGGIPFIIGYNIDMTDEDIDGILDHIDGLLLSGGGDMDSKFFDQPLHEKASGIVEERDVFEMKIFTKALERDMPVLGICRGLQVMNVACGGDLHQHIENHSFPEQRTDEVHGVRIEKRTKLFQILKKEKINVNSLHHQAIGKVAPPFVVSGLAEDGTIEGVEIPEKKFCIGVQWHPEALLVNENSDALVGTFIECAKRCMV